MNTSSQPYYDAIEATKRFIAKSYQGGLKPKIALMMGTGLSDLHEQLTNKWSISYNDIPNFPKSTVQSHAGQFCIGKLFGVEVIILAGRWHYYEGYSTKELTFPIRVLKMLGCEKIILTNVSGGTNEHFSAGDVIQIKDHINLIPDHPLRGENDERLGIRFPDMMHAYSPALIKKFQEGFAACDINYQEGVYVALQGPSLETPAEYKFIHNIGGDMVGMSTVPEVIVANHAGLEVAALSIISNECYPLEKLTTTTVEEVIAVAHEGAQKLKMILEKTLPTL